MKKIFKILFFISATVLGQEYTVTPPPGGNPQAHVTQPNNANEYLAQNYFDRGEFDKAIMMYEELVKRQPTNYQFFQKQVACYQQLKQFDKAEETIQTKLNKTKYPNLYVELGYNFQLQKQQEKADKNYKNAIELLFLINRKTILLYFKSIMNTNSISV